MITSFHPSKKNCAYLPKTFLVIGASLAIALSSVQAQVSIQDIVRSEKIRRQNLVIKSEQFYNQGNAHIKKGNYRKAIELYTQSLNILPKARVTEESRKYLEKKIKHSRQKFAKHLAKNGANVEARKELEKIVDRDGQPIKTPSRVIGVNTTSNLTHVKKVEQVRNLLYQGESDYNLGKFDAAEASFRKIIVLDRYNTAAQNWLQRIENQKQRFYRNARNLTRVELLNQVEKAWVIDRSAKVIKNIYKGATVDAGSSQSAQLKELIDTTLISVNFDNKPLSEAINYIKQAVKSASGTKPNIVYIGEKGSNDNDIEVTLSLQKVPAYEVLRQIARQTPKPLSIVIEDYTVVLRVDSENSGELIRRRFTVPPNFFSNLNSNTSSDDFDDEESVASIASPKEILREAGLSLPEGSSVNFFKGNNTLLITSTRKDLSLVEGLIASNSLKTPISVRVVSKFIEVSQSNSSEIGFDWIIQPFGVGSDVFVGGGNGSGSVKKVGDFVQTVGGRRVISNTTGLITGGLRSGTQTQINNSIDAIIQNSSGTQVNAVAPTIASLTGIFTDGQVQAILRGLSQKTGSDLMTAPSIIVAAGKTGVMQVAREFIYPEQYDAPQVPSSIGNTSNDSSNSGSITFAPIVPATPSGFKTKNVGVVLAVTPSVNSDRTAISLDLAPEIVDFDGFINYGSPINAIGTDAIGNSVSIVVTENRIEQPVFSVRKATTSVTLYDGYTVSIGGLVSDSVVTTNDKVPIFGDIPVIGRLFQSKSEQRIRRNLIIFVTTTLIDPAGRRIRQSINSVDGLANNDEETQILPESKE